MFSALKYKIFEILGIQKDPKAITTGEPQFWYGRVNSWACAKKSLLTRDLNLCVKHGVTGYAIELIGWTKMDSDPASYRSKAYYRTVKERYEYLVKACRARGLWLFVSVVNDNAGRDGNTCNPRLDSQKENVEFALKLVKENGSKNVVVQPVAEIQTVYGANLNKQWTAVFNGKGFQTVYNGAGSPLRVGDGSRWFAVHPASIKAAVKSSAFVVSDHALVLRKLCKGGDINGLGDPQALQEWRNFYSVTYGNPVICFYHFNYDGSKGSDKESIKTMGEGRW